MNELEKALRTESDDDMEAYLEFRPASQIRADIEEIRRKASDETAATRKIAAILTILNEQ